LTEVWPGRFRFPRDEEPGEVDIFDDGMRNAYQYANNPVKLANYVYDDANRDAKHKLGNIQPGDGWMFRGRGPGQLTGRDNYQRCADSETVPDIVRFPDLLLEPPVGAVAIGWYWQTNGFNELADEGRFEDIVRKYNGGLIGWDDRLQRLQAVRSALGAIA
jgi:putative chitinase